MFFLKITPKLVDGAVHRVDIAAVSVQNKDVFDAMADEAVASVPERRLKGGGLHRDGAEPKLHMMLRNAGVDRNGDKSRRINPPGNIFSDHRRRLNVMDHRQMGQVLLDASGRYNGKFHISRLDALPRLFSGQLFKPHDVSCFAVQVV